MILYLDFFSSKNVHEVFNHSNLKVLASNNSVLYVGDNPFELDNLVFKKIHIVPYGSKFSGILRKIQFLVYTLHFTLKYSRKSEMIFFSYVFPEFIWLIKYIAIAISKKLIINVHGELYYDVKRFNGNFSKSCYYKYRNCVFLDFIFPSEAILKNYLDYIEEISVSNYHWVQHGVVTYNLLHESKPGDTKKIGLVGTFRKSKVSVDLFKLVNNEKFRNYKFVLVGSFNSTDRSLLERCGVDLDPRFENTYVSKFDYLDRLNSVDYAIYLLDSEIYRFTASGSLLDALMLSKPVISLKNDFIEDLFNKYGYFGYLYDSIDELFLKMTDDICLNKNFDFKLIMKKIMDEHKSNLMNVCLHNSVRHG